MCRRTRTVEELSHSLTRLDVHVVCGLLGRRRLNIHAGQACEALALAQSLLVPVLLLCPSNWFLRSGNWSLT